MPEEIKGFMRLVQTKVKVQVIGQDSVGEFDASEKTTMERKPEYKNLSAYIVLHEQDVAQFVRNTDLLGKLAEDPEIRALAVKKGILK
jgi:predicted NUDIX family phosphoesterase